MSWLNISNSWRAKRHSAGATRRRGRGRTMLGEAAHPVTPSRLVAEKITDAPVPRRRSYGRSTILREATFAVTCRCFHTIYMQVVGWCPALQ